MKRKLNKVGLALLAGLGIVAAPATAVYGRPIDDRYPPYTRDYRDQRIVDTLNQELLQMNNPDFRNINVTSHRGRVRLSGFVSNEWEKRRAGRIARQIAGVRSVDNDIRVGGHYFPH